MIDAGKKEAVILPKIQRRSRIGRNLIVPIVRRDSNAPPNAPRLTKLSIQKTARKRREKVVSCGYRR